MTWDSARLRNQIEREWRGLEMDLGMAFAKDGDEIGTTTRDVLSKYNLSEQELRDLGESCAALRPGFEQRSEFQNAMLRMIAKVYLKSGDREALVNLLSTRCPGRLGLHVDLEFYLAAFGTKFKDPILILSEAYAKCQVPAVRAELAAAVRRGFQGSGIVGRDDAEFVKNAMHWYEENKNELVVNSLYPANVSSILGDYRKNPLFIEKKNADTWRPNIDMFPKGRKRHRSEDDTP